MDSRDRPLMVVRNIPPPLKVMIERYQNDRGLSTFSQAVKELLESHPEIAKRVQRVYDMEQELSR